MSTKTTIKRIALVAAASLGLGLMSSIPAAQANVVGTPTVTVVNSTNTTTALSDSTTAATITVAFTSNSGTKQDSAALTIGAMGLNPNDGTFDSGMILMTALDSSGTTSDSVTPFGKQSKVLAWSPNGGYGRDSLSPKAGAVGISQSGTSAGLISFKWGVWLDSSVTRYAGTYTLSYSVVYYSEGVLSTTQGSSGTFTITVTNSSVAAASTVSASATTSSKAYAGSTFGGNMDGVDSTLSLAATPTNTAVAVVRVVQRTAAGALSRESITATLDKGNVGGSGGATGKSVTFIADADGDTDIYIYGDGTTGTATLTLKTTSVTFGNRTITWYGTDVATITVTKLGNRIGSSASNVLLAVGKDAQGNVSQSALYAVATDRNIIATTATTGTTCSYVAAYSGNICSLSGATDGTTTITVWNTNSASTRTVSGTAELTVSTKSPVALKLATDKSSYVPGEVIYLRLWAVDSSGNPVSPGTYSNLVTTAGITTSMSLGSSSDTTTGTSSPAPVLGFTTSSDGYASAEAIKLYKLYAPVSGGDLTFSVTGGTALPATGQVAVTTKVTVTNSGEAALAAVTALASQVSAFITKINAQITTLTDLVMKIQKKVKA